MENGNTPLDDILNDEPTNDIAEQPEDTGQPRDEHGRFAPKDTGENQPVDEQPEPSVTPTPEVEPQHIPIAALKDERAKRQQLEAQLQQYEAYLQQLAAQQQPQQAPEMPDPITDPYGHAEWLAQQVRAQVLQEVQQVNQQQLGLSRVEVSEMLARQKFEDYDAKVEIFKQAAQENPFLIGELQRAPDPATYAYQAAQRYVEAKQYGTAAPSREQLEAELRAKIMAEIGVNRPTAPTTLASERSVGSRSGPAWSGPTPIGDILNR